MGDRIHISYHKSGLKNIDYSTDKGGTQHIHQRGDEIKQIWEHPNGQRLEKDDDGVWRDSETGEVFRGKK